jgi:hypothetical protein
MKEEKTAMTVYFPEKIWKIIGRRTAITGRSKTEEVIHLIKLGLKYGQEADVRALSQLIQHLPKDIE